MRNYPISVALLLTFMGCCAFTPRRAEQTAPTFELGGNYTYVRTNAGSRRMWLY